MWLHRRHWPSSNKDWKFLTFSGLRWLTVLFSLRDRVICFLFTAKCIQSFFNVYSTLIIFICNDNDNNHNNGNRHRPSSSNHCCFCRFFRESKRFSLGIAAYHSKATPIHITARRLAAKTTKQTSQKKISIRKTVAADYKLCMPSSVLALK